MDQDRREFLRTAALAGGVLVTTAWAGAAPSPALAQGAAPAGSGAMPRGLTLATLRRDRGVGLGVKTEKGILDVVRAEQDFREGAPLTISDVFAGRGDVGALQRLNDKARASGKADYFIAEKDAKFGPAVTDPEKIVCIGLNYRKHAAETGNPVPPVPILFNKFNNALNHAGGTVKISAEHAEKFDYEAELVIVIGRTARDVPVDKAKDYILGYATGNDFTARDLQSRTSQWMIGKTLDGSGLVGPWIVSADQVDGDNLKIELRVNGEVRQSSNTNDMVFNCAKLVSYISEHMTLKPGDIIFTGTPEGVIAGKAKDQQVWLKPGDKLVTSIERLGDLEFTLS
jgi:2-keto-4-pentenoate hydratase/2-oxohepta-3-ene-1,7-dioic acid hydratase in catechol pathway